MAATRPAYRRMTASPVVLAGPVVAQTAAFAGPNAVETGVSRSFVYRTIDGENGFVVKAVDRSGNTSAPSNTATALLWTR
ncbi:MAG: hypothetical protein ACRD1D_14615 [Acidimicrobiales bacterium]